jgi:hypothetical protein
MALRLPLRGTYALRCLAPGWSRSSSGSANHSCNHKLRVESCNAAGIHVGILTTRPLTFTLHNCPPPTPPPKVPAFTHRPAPVLNNTHTHPTTCSVASLQCSRRTAQSGTYQCCQCVTALGVASSHGPPCPLVQLPPTSNTLHPHPFALTPTIAPPPLPLAPHPPPAHLQCRRGCAQHKAEPLHQRCQSIAALGVASSQEASLTWALPPHNLKEAQELGQSKEAVGNLLATQHIFGFVPLWGGGGGG